MDDLQWLRKTQQLIKGQDNWTLWCEVVGWDSNEVLIESPEAHETATDEAVSPSLDNETLSPPTHSRGLSIGSLRDDVINEEDED